MLKTGFITAMDKELQPLLARFSVTEKLEDPFGVIKAYEGNREIFIIRSGIGEIASAAATQHLIDVFGVELVVNFGIAGALEDHFHPGELCVATGVFHYEFKTDDRPLGRYYDLPDTIIPVSMKYVQACVDKGLIPVRCASGNRFIDEKAERESLYKLSGAHICDMECAGVALTAFRNGVECLIIKAVCDSESGTYYDFVAESVKSLSDTFLPVIRSVLV